jgi:hypothetical protein
MKRMETQARRAYPSPPDNRRLVPMSRSDAIYLVLPFVVAFALGFAFVTVYRRRGGSSRPWWGDPWLWLALCAVSVVLGVLVWPGLFGGVFLFLPFVWIRRPSRTPRMDPRSNGHTGSEGHGPG